MYLKHKIKIICAKFKAVESIEILVCPKKKHTVNLSLCFAVINKEGDRLGKVSIILDWTNKESDFTLKI